MSDCKENKNPLKRGGTSQQQRFLSGLGKDYVQVDEREYADWILFATEFSKYLHYYQADGSIAGTWLPFFSRDVSAILGSVAVQNMQVYQKDIKERFDVLKKNDSEEDQVKKKLNELFSSILSLSFQLDLFYLRLDSTLAFKSTLVNLIKIKLAPALRRLLEYYKGAVAESLVTESPLNGWRILNSEVVQASGIVSGTGLSKDWWQGAASSWSNYYSSLIVANTSIYGDSSLSVNRRISRAAHHNLFTSVFDQYLSVYTKLVAEAEKELLKTLGDWNTHPAHYALFLAFLKLFRYAQEQLNTLTGRHLDFYYKEVLRLYPKKAEPNKAHILVTLAKQIESYALSPSQLLKAGKDSEGKEVLYALEKEESFNKAKVTALKSVYKGNSLSIYPNKDDHAVSEINPTVVDNEGRLFASPVMNSADGLGKELKTEQKEWHPFVNKVYKETKLTDIAMPNAQIGFAVASHYLYLSEGERKVILRLGTNGNAALTNKEFRCFVTTSKGWFAIPPTDIVATKVSAMSNGQACAEIQFNLHGDAPPVVNYQAALHGGLFQVEIPVLKLVLKNEDSAPYKYDSLAHLTVSSVEVNVEVGDPLLEAHASTGIKELILSNDYGPLDPAKPFQPFGPQPRKDNTFLIGNKEVFSKKNAKIRLNIEWAGLSDFDAGDMDFDTVSPAYPNTKVQFLEKGVWTAHSETNIFNSTNTNVSVFSPLKNIPFTALRPYPDEYGMYDTSTREGFLRLVLNGNFGYKEYQDALTLHLIEISKPGATVTEFDRKEPYLPTIQSLYLSYSANVIANLTSTSSEDFAKREVQFFHLYPFGEAEQHSYISKKLSNYLLPQFSKAKVGTPYVGELYIGVENLKSEQSVQLLFQVLEGSTDPLVEKPEEHVFWEYLGQNEWKPFDNKQISDATRQLVQSGIVSFVIPEDATTDNTLLPPGYLWLKAAIGTSAEAICKILTIDAQAALVSFQPHQNAADFLDKALPAASISKLKSPDTSVKKIEQPYTSFGGRPTEDNAHFYVRVSERLRHKARAITIWDYEHLILEAFPQIYKVKCLNHTKIDGGVYNEVLPGHVAIITIPSIVNRNDVNPLKPYTNQNTLLEIEEFLKKKVSCHVKLTVRHPQFEEVRMRFKLKLLKGFDDFTFYSKQLRQEITEYLSPWAFDGQGEVQFGGKIHKSSLINFIEERPYVDFIVDVELFHRINELTPEITAGEEIEASTARSVLVSAQAFQHDITQAVVLQEQPESECSPHVT
jgi:hypothetical protein